MHSRGVFRVGCSYRTRAPLGGASVSAPVSFTLDGRQVIAATAGRALFVFGLLVVLFIDPQALVATPECRDLAACRRRRYDPRGLRIRAA